MKSWTTRPMMAAALLVGVLLIAAYIVSLRSGQNTVTAYFDRAVAVYPGTDLRVMGVQIGEVTAVVPEGDRVRVEMRYDDDYTLPADATAAIVTPTLIADRYVQIGPAYGGGDELADGAEIPLERTDTPIELDRMFKSLDDLSVTLGPQDGAPEGALASLLDAGADFLEGNGEAGSQTIRQLSAVAETLADNRGPLFDDISALASITETLAANDTTVDAFITDLSDVSEQLAGERDELAQVLDSLAESLTTVEGFIKENRAVLGRDINSLSSLLERVDNQKDALGLVAQKGALAMGNLALAYDPSTISFGSRMQVAPGVMLRPDNFICQTLGGPIGVETIKPICDVLTSLFPAAKETTPPAASVPAASTTDGDAGGLLSGTTDSEPLTDWTDLLKVTVP